MEKVSMKFLTHPDVRKLIKRKIVDEGMTVSELFTHALIESGLFKKRSEIALLKREL